MNAEVNIFAIVPIDVCMDKRLTLEQLRVLVALLSFRNKDTNTAWPTREQLSERTGMHKSNISAATTALVELGWLIKEGKGGFSKSTRYQVTVPQTVAEQATVAQSATVAEQAIRGVAQSATRMPVAESATRKEQTIELTKRTDQLPDVRVIPKIEAEFAEFWRAYPKKVAPSEAMKAWKKANPDLQQVLNALAWQKQSDQWTKGGGQFIPHPTTYINQGRWMDEPVIEEAF